jgi:transposase-like protein
MKRKCPNNNCSNFNNSTTIVRDGYYQRKDDSKKIARFKCTHCGKRFSAATNSLYFGQKKRRINALVRKLLSSGVSMRRIAKIVKVHQITVARKVIFLAQLARMSQDELLNYLRKNKSMHIQFDDLITKENTKLKPLTVPLAVDVKTRIILSAEVAQIPAFGHLAEKARLKYGIRKSLHKDAMTKMF